MQVVVADGKIVDVDASPKAPASADASYDLRGATLMPGLIDCHVHCMASHVNLALTARMSNAIAVISALPILKRHARPRLHHHPRRRRRRLFAGPGFRDGDDRRAAHLFPPARRCRRPAGTAISAPAADQLETCACHFRIANIARVVDGVDDVRRAARDELTKGATQVKVMASGGVASPNDPIGNTGYSMDELRAIVAEADAWQTYVMAHAYTPKAIRRAVEAGVRTIEHGNLIDEPTAQFLKERGVFVTPTLITYDALSSEGPALGLPPESVAKIDDVRLVGREAITMLHRVGVRMAYGSDLLGPSHSHQSEELRIRSDLIGNLGDAARRHHCGGRPAAAERPARRDPSGRDRRPPGGAPAIRSRISACWSAGREFGRDHEGGKLFKNELAAD
jgi:imidazolonepropionase-like amidohydrolase